MCEKVVGRERRRKGEGIKNREHWNYKTTETHEGGV